MKPILAEKYGVNNIALFGSYSRDENTSESDIDILIHFKNPDYDSLYSSFTMLQKVFGDIPVQIVSRGGVKPRYFEAIKSDLLYA